jgi:hypothetical protein
MLRPSKTTADYGKDDDKDKELSGKLSSASPS